MNEYITYRFSWEELPVTIQTVQRFIGYEETEAPEPIPDYIREVINNCKSLFYIEGGYVIHDYALLEKGLIKVQEVELPVGKIVSHQLRNSEKAAVFVCTAGQNISNWSRKMMEEGDMMMAYIADALGSIVVEAAMDKVQEQLRRTMQKMGLKITNRYSPGYCGWHVSGQHQLFSLLPDNPCGIKLTDTSLMHPIKSVSGIIGIGTDVRFNDYTCNICEMKDCIYRNKKI